MFSDNSGRDLVIAEFIHDDIIKSSGGAFGYHDKGLVESALARPMSSAFGIDLYRSVYMKAAALLDSIARNHGFRDGNKRTAMALASLYLENNDVHVVYSNEEYTKIMLWVVNEKPSIKAIAKWLENHSISV